MKRYWLSILVLAAGLAFAVYTTKSAHLNFLDLPSFIIVVAVPLLFVTVFFGFKDTYRAFATLHKKENESEALHAALVFFNVYGKAIWVSAFIAVITGGIGVLRNLNDPAAIGPIFAFGLIAVLYCGVVQLAVVLPHTISIHKQLGNSGTRGDMFNLFGSLFGVVSVYLLFMIILTL